MISYKVHLVSLYRNFELKIRNLQRSNFQDTYVGGKGTYRGGATVTELPIEALCFQSWLLLSFLYIMPEYL